MKEYVSEYTTNIRNDLNIIYYNLFNRLRAHNILLYPYHDMNHIDEAEFIN